MRGATSAQTPVYLAGVRLNDNVGGTANLSTIPLWFLNRIEIYRSNAPLAGDQLGIGGAIFFEPRRPEGPEARRGRDGWGASERARCGRAPASATKKRRLWSACGSTAHSNDYSYVNDSGTRFDRSNDHTSVFSNADTKRLDVWAMEPPVSALAVDADLVVNDVERDQGLQTFALFPTTSARASFSRRLRPCSTQAPCAARAAS